MISTNAKSCKQGMSLHNAKAPVVCPNSAMMKRIGPVAFKELKEEEEEEEEEEDLKSFNCTNMVNATTNPTIRITASAIFWYRVRD